MATQPAPPPPQPKLNPYDFDLEDGTPLGCGAIAVVNRCLHRPTQRWFAVKALSKIQLLQLKKVEAVMGEKEALFALGPHAGIVYLHGTMQTDDELFFVMDLLPGGDLLEHIRRVGGKRRLAGLDARCPCLTLKDARLITAQLLLVLDHVFRHGYVLRDLKPENIMFDGDGRCVLIDFDTIIRCDVLPVSNHGYALVRDRPGDAGVVKPITKVSEIQAARRQSSTFAGTAHYVSPEGLGENKYSYASDLFALGSTLFHMLAGRPLFNGASSFFVMKEIKEGVEKKAFPAALQSTNMPGAESLIRQLCAADPAQRIGVDRDAGGVFSLRAFKEHSFFDGFDWASAAYPPAVRREEPLGRMPASQREATRAPAYDDTPFHTDEYAQYVLQAGDSMFERFAEHAQTAPPEPRAADDDDAAASTTSSSEEGADALPTADANAEQNAAVGEDEIVDIVDDVGLGRAAGAGEPTQWRGGFDADADECAAAAADV